MQPKFSVYFFYIKGIQMIKKTFLAATLLAATASAQAELVEFDWEVADDGHVTLDTQSGNIWLDLGLTANMSINDVKSLVEDDSRFSGWRLPTVEEVHELAANTFDIDPSMIYSGSNGVSNEEFTQHSLIGYDTSYTYGLFEKDGKSYLFGSNSRDLYLNFHQSESLDFKVSSRGVYLVSNDYNIAYDEVSINELMNPSVSDVSAPMALGAFGLMLGLAGLRSRKSS
jgi:hypothetical protein